MRQIMKSKIFKIITMTLMFVMLFSVSALADSNNHKAGKNITWEYDKADETITISGTGTVKSNYKLRNLKKAKTIVIEEGVTGIGSYAFSNMNVTKISLPKSLKKIGDYAFYKTKIKSMTINSAIKDVGTGIFESCRRLKKVTWNLNYLPSSTFSGCRNLEDVTFNKKLKSIGDFAFSKTKISTIEVPDTVIYLGAGAFYGCKNLTSAVVAGSVRKIRVNTFSNTPNLQKVVLKSGVKEIAEKAFYNTGTRTVQLPDSLIKISQQAFANSANLNEINIPDGVTKISDETFSKCTSLKNVTFGSGITFIGENAFFKCSSLENITIPGNVKTIDYKAFAKSGIKKLVLEEGVENVEFWSFSYCNRLESVSVPSTVISISSTAFVACNSLTSMNIDEKNTVYDSRERCLLTKDGSTMLTVFAGVSGTFKIPDSVTSINGDAFYGCTKISAFASDAEENYYISDGILYSADKHTLIKCPINKTGAVTIPNQVYTIESGAFSQSRASSISIPDTVTSMGACAFEYCQNITSITIPGSVKKISVSAFWGCSKLNKVVIEQGVKKIYRNAFNECTNLKKVVVPLSVSFISKTAFSNDNTTFYCSKSSKMVAYAKKHGYLYKLI